MKHHFLLRTIALSFLFASPLLAQEHNHAPGAPPPKPKNGVIALDVASDKETIVVATVSREDDSKTIQVTVSKDQGRTFQKPLLVSLPELKINSPSRGYFPQVALFKNKIAIIWNAPGSGKFGAGNLETAVSLDLGKTWRKGSSPSDDLASGRYSFHDLTADENGILHAVWLDSRDGEQGLRYASSKDFGLTWKKNISIDTRTCQCCWNRLYSVNPKKLLVLYRDLDPRDMALGVSTDNGNTWTSGSRAGTFDWSFNGCPHQGGSLAHTKSGSLFASVWTGKDKSQGLHLIKSSDLGKTWTQPRLVSNDRSSQGELAASEKSVHLVWRDVENNTGIIRLKSSLDDGVTWSEMKDLSKGADASHPHIVAFEKHITVFWIEEGETKKLITKVVE